MLVVTGLLAIGVTFIIVPTEPMRLESMAQRRANIISHPLSRDLFTSIPIFRDLDAKLRPDARIFFSGMIGEQNMRNIHYYYFARTYLFPRDVEISLDHHAKFVEWFDGVDCSSMDQLRTNGFDVMLFINNDRLVVSVPLTEKGQLKQ